MFGMVGTMLVAGSAAATGQLTVFDELHRLDAVAAEERGHGAAMLGRVQEADAQLERRWASMDVATRAAAPIRDNVSRSLARWMGVQRVVSREAFEAPNAGADTRRLLAYAAPRALPGRLRDVDVVQRADAETAEFGEVLHRRARFTVAAANALATADALDGERRHVLVRAQTEGAPQDIARSDAEFAETLAALPAVRPEADFHRHKGTLARPVTQAPEYHFGATAPLVRATGWTYRPEEGADVHSVHDGDVVFVGGAQGWGLVVVVDHGGGYRSVYAHLEAANVAQGDRVARAEVIAQAGATGSLDGVRLYFELRKEDRPIDPAGWLLRR